MAKTRDERLKNLSVKLADLSQKAAEASEEDDASLVEAVSVDCVWLAPQAASARPAVMEPNAASAWRRVRLVFLSIAFSSHVVGVAGWAPLFCGVVASGVATCLGALRPAASADSRWARPF